MCIIGFFSFSCFFFLKFISPFFRPAQILYWPLLPALPYGTIYFYATASKTSKHHSSFCSIELVMLNNLHCAGAMHALPRLPSSICLKKSNMCAKSNGPKSAASSCENVIFRRRCPLEPSGCLCSGPSHWGQAAHRHEPGTIPYPRQPQGKQNTNVGQRQQGLEWSLHVRDNFRLLITQPEAPPSGAAVA